MTAEARLRAVPFGALAGLADALAPALSEVVEGAAAERVLDRFLRAHRDLDAAGRQACAEAIFGVGLWRRRLRHGLGGRPDSPRLLLALLLRDLAGRTDAAALAGLPAEALPPPGPLPTALADRTSLPDWLAAELTRAAGAEAGALADALNLPGPVALRVNRLLGDRDGLAEALAAEGVATRPSALARDGLVVLSPRANIRGLAAWRDGRCEVQDEGSQLLALALGARAGERVLDRCAGAGGKALALAGAVGPDGRVLACDTDEERLARLVERAARAGAARIVERLGASPASSLTVDAALVDAPCSELGPLRRGPDLRWRLDPAGFDALPPLQLALLRDAARCVRAGGRLVYATCTFRSEENDAVALAFESAEPGWERVAPVAPAEVLGPDRFLRTFPHRHGTDGFFAAAWVRRAELDRLHAMTGTASWDRFRRYRSELPALGFSLDASRMGLDEPFLDRLAKPLEQAFAAMAALEAGAIANPDEQRMVGHYWLRAPERAPRPELRREIEAALAEVKRFAADVHAARVKPERAARFTRLLCVGIGGSALGPMFVADALGGASDRLAPAFLDNTDPDGFARVLARLGPALGETLVVVTSKSGGTPETRNGMLAVEAAFTRAGLSFARHAVAVTQAGSALDRRAEAAGWLARFPMWDWVGGRTSELSAVGLLPAALQGLDVDGLLAGAAAMDQATRVADAVANPAALLALCWYQATGGVGDKAMVVLPYKDSLLLLSRYLQQLVMESLGKRLDLQGHRVEQGLTVYGNKGSTDQHAYVQQLRDGVPDFFAAFVRVLEPGGEPLEVEPGVTAGRLPPRPAARHPRRALRERAGLADHHRAAGRRARRGGAHRPLRAGGRALRLAHRRQRLPPAGRRGGQEGGGRRCSRCRGRCWRRSGPSRATRRRWPRPPA